MLAHTLVGIIAVATVTFILIVAPDKRQIRQFPHQPWTPREALPLYWVLLLISLISYLLHRSITNNLLFQVLSYSLTLCGAFALLIGIRVVIFKRKLSAENIGLRPSAFSWFFLLAVLQYAILSVYSRKTAQGLTLGMWSLVYYSIVLIIWPIIEEVYFLGMLYIPTSRKVGLVKGALLVSLLRAFLHFHFDTISLAGIVVFGLLGCFLYIQTRGILAPLLVHSVLNFLTLLREVKLI